MTSPVTSAADVDEQFARPYVDVDEMRGEPRPHRYVHGGFEGTTVRFSLHFPDRDLYRGRFLHNPGSNLDGPGSEDFVALLPIFGSRRPVRSRVLPGLLGGICGIRQRPGGPDVRLPRDRRGR